MSTKAQDDPEGIKVWQQGPDGVLHVYFNGVDGKPLGDFTGTSYFNGSYTVYNPVGGGTPMVYFAGKRIDNNTVEDRSATAVVAGGQAMKFFPYGEVRSGTAGVVQYASYTRDSVVTNLDYAQQRWYSSQIDRFTTVDPKAGSANPVMPQSWNKYAYTLGDPVNNSDPTGLEGEQLETICFAGGLWWPSGVCDVAYGAYFNRPVFALQPFGHPPYRVVGYKRTGQKETTIADVLATLLKDVLSTDNSCSQWLTGQNFSAAQFIQAIMGSGPQDYTFGYGAISPNSTAAFVGNTLPGTDAPVPGLPIDSSITVNSNGAFFNSAYTVGSGKTQYTGGTLQAQAFILLHELAHEVNALGFLPDAGNSKAEATNNQLVQQNCGSEVAALP